MPLLWKQDGKVGARPLVRGLSLLRSHWTEPQEQIESRYCMEPEDRTMRHLYAFAIAAALLYVAHEITKLLPHH